MHHTQLRDVRDLPAGGFDVTLQVPMRYLHCPRCGVRVERLDWLAEEPGFTNRMARQIGRRCRQSTIEDVAREYRLNWYRVKQLDQLYMTEQLAAAGPPSPRVIGIDEIAIAARHQYRIVVSDLELRRPIWFGGRPFGRQPRWVLSLARPRKIRPNRTRGHGHVEAFRKSTLKPGNAPQARIIYDKFQILRHLGEAMDRVRKQEYARLTGLDRRYIKGQRFVLLSRWDNPILRSRKR